MAGDAMKGLIFLQNIVFNHFSYYEILETTAAVAYFLMDEINFAEKLCICVTKTCKNQLTKQICNFYSWKCLLLRLAFRRPYPCIVYMILQVDMLFVLVSLFFLRPFLFGHRCGIPIYYILYFCKMEPIYNFISQTNCCGNISVIK